MYVWVKGQIHRKMVTATILLVQVSGYRFKGVRPLPLPVYYQKHQTFHTLHKFNLLVL